MGISRDELREPDAVDCGDLECAICMGLAVDAVAVPCGHIYCRTCIERVLEKDTRCPLCRGGASIDTLQTCPLINLRVNAAVVCCEGGAACGWYGRCDARRAHGKVCPIAKATEFTVVMQGKLGIELEVTSCNRVIVRSLLAEGNAHSYNESMVQCPARCIRPGCTLVETNGIRGDGRELLYVLQKTDRLGGVQRLVFSKPREFCATVRTDSKDIGLDLAILDEDSPFLEIRGVKPGGAVMDHNSSGEREILKSYDRIVEVNGVSGHGDDLLQLIQKSKICQMRICRIFP